MRNTVFLLLCTVFLFSCENKSQDNSLSRLNECFKSPRNNVQTSVYWYWINDNITEEGALADLEAMKKAGIDRAFIGFIGLTDRGPAMGKCKMFSQDWWNVIHSVFKHAAELGIEIGVFNSPGWSQSGGPWVSSNQAMRYLTNYEYSVNGGKINYTLPDVPSEFQDVRLLAVKEDKYDASEVKPISFITNDKQIKSLSRLNDNDIESPVYIPDQSVVEMKFAEPTEISCLVFNVAVNKRSVGKCKLWYKYGDDVYKPLSTVNINRFNFDIKVGFDPDAPIVYSFEPITTSSIKLEFNELKTPIALTEISAYSHALLMDYPEKSLAKMFQQTLPSWNEYQWNFLDSYGNDDNLKTNDVIDLTNKVQSNILNAELPSGKWKLLRFGMLPTQVMNHPSPVNAKGLEIDKMNSQHINYHFDKFIGEILRRIPASDRTSFKYVVADSYETGGQNFTDDMIEKFEQTYKYSPVPFFPVFNGVIVNNRMSSDRFLWDFRRLIADRIAYDYVGGLRKICNENGLLLWLENYGHWGFPAEFLQYGGQADEVAGEFWSYGMLGNIENRAASSCGHIYGKNRISAESFTCGPDQPFSRYPAVMKQRGDKFFSEGINSTLLHLYILQPDNKVPGINAWFGNEFNRNNTWFPYMDLFTDYLKRCNLMLQQGQNVADVAYYIGEDVPKMTGIRQPEIPLGYQFDYINSEVLLRDVEVEDGYLALPHGTRYKVLVLPPQNTMRPEVLEKVYRLISEGGVVLSSVPVLLSPSNENQPYADDRIKELSDKLWNGNSKIMKTIGKGRFYFGYNLQDVFDDIELVEDVNVDTSDILYAHRETKTCDIYFITNQTGEYKNMDISFRTCKPCVEMWNPVSGETSVIKKYSENLHTSTLKISLSPYESMFYVFSNAHSTGNQVNTFEDFNTCIPDSGWTIHFNNPALEVDTVIKTDRLDLWNNSNHGKIKYYSGTATYTNIFNIDNRTLSESKRVELNIEDLNVMAKVYINNKYAGGLWTRPYNLNVTDYLKSGMNKVEIKVVNTWVNRLIGDADVDTDRRKTFTSVNPWKSSDKLMNSGLKGEVSLIFKR